MNKSFAQGNVIDQQQKNNSSMKEFVTACTYGVLAGTLVGAATLAFENKPSESLQNVARGASLGLYSGIFLGFYVIYIVPNQIEQEKMKLYEEQGLPPTGFNNFQLLPIISEKGLEGVQASMQLASW